MGQCALAMLAPLAQMDSSSLGTHHHLRQGAVNTTHYPMHRTDTYMSTQLLHYTWCYCHTHTLPFYAPLSGTTRVLPVPERHSPTHTLHHHPSFISLLLPSATIHSILPAQITYFTVSFAQPLSKSPWSTSWSRTLHYVLHIFLHPMILLSVC